MDLNWNDQLARKAHGGCCAPFHHGRGAGRVRHLAGAFHRLGPQVLAAGLAYLTPRRSWRPLLTVALLLFLAMFAVRMTVLFSYWYNGFYSALQALDQTAFWHFLAIFGVLATVHVLHAGRQLCRPGFRHPLARVAQRAPDA